MMRVRAPLKTTTETSVIREPTMQWYDRCGKDGIRDGKRTWSDRFMQRV